MRDISIKITLYIDEKKNRKSEDNKKNNKRIRTL